MGKALEEALKKIEKDYGRGTIISNENVDKEIERLSTGSLTLDIATGGSLSFLLVFIFL